MSQDTGGPAKDKTLLDEYAGQAMQGLLSSAAGLQGIERVCKRPPKEQFEQGGVDPTKGTAILAYTYAEAMITEKRRRENDG